MSAQPCGCDPEEHYACEAHLRDRFAKFATTPFVRDEALGISMRVVDEYNIAKDGVVSPIDLAMADINQILAERVFIVATLSAFYRAEISMSSLQPILDLAVQLNPDLKELKR